MLYLTLVLPTLLIIACTLKGRLMFLMVRYCISLNLPLGRIKLMMRLSERKGFRGSGTLC